MKEKLVVMPDGTIKVHRFYPGIGWVIVLLACLALASCATTTPTRANDMREAADDAEQVAGNLQNNPTVTAPTVEWLRAHAGTLRAWSAE